MRLLVLAKNVENVSNCPLFTANKKKRTPKRCGPLFVSNAQPQTPGTYTPESEPLGTVLLARVEPVRQRAADALRIEHQPIVMSAQFTVRCRVILLAPLMIAGRALVSRHLEREKQGKGTARQRASSACTRVPPNLTRKAIGYIVSV